MASYTTEQMKKALLGGIDEQGEEQTGLFGYLSAPGQYLRGGVSDVLSWLPGGVPAHGFTGRKMWGDEVLQEHGMENKPGLDMTDVLGFGMDMTVDPLNLFAGAGAIKGGLKLARMLPKLASSAKRAETLAQMKAALGAIPGAVKRQAVPLGAGLGAMLGGSALMQSNEEGSDWKDLLGMGMMTAPLVLPIGMAAARKGKTGWARQVAEFNAAEDAKIMQRIAEAKTPEEATRLRGLLSTAGKDAPAAAAPPLMQTPQAVTRERFSNPEEFYRVIVGDDAFKDIVESGLVRTKNITKEGASLKDKLGSRPTAFPSFSKGSASLETYGGDANHYVVVTSDTSLRPSTAGRHGKGTTHFPTDPQGKHLPSLAGESVDVYRHDGNGMYRLVYSKGKPVTNSPAVIAPTAATALPPISTAPRAQYEADFLEQLGFWDANRKSEAFKAVRDAGIADVRAPEAEPILRAMAPPGLAGMDDWVDRVQKAMRTSESTRQFISKESLNEARAAMQAAPLPGTPVFHGTHSDIQEFIPRQVKSYNSLGTWFTGSEEKAMSLYGPKVYQSSIPENARLIEFGQDQTDFLKVLGGNAELAKKTGHAKEAEALLQQLPDFNAEKQYNIRLRDEGWSQQLANEFPNIERIKKANAAADRLLKSEKYMTEFRKMLESFGYDGIVWRKSNIDLRKGDAPHDVYVMFNKTVMPAKRR